MLCRITDWIGWALVELSVKLSAKEESDLDGFAQKMSEIAYNAGCTMYGAFDQ